MASSILSPAALPPTHNMATQTNGSGCATLRYPLHSCPEEQEWSLQGQMSIQILMQRWQGPMSKPESTMSYK